MLYCFDDSPSVNVTPTTPFSESIIHDKGAFVNMFFEKVSGFFEAVFSLQEMPESIK